MKVSQKANNLTLNALDKIFSRRHFEIFFLFFPENRILHFMQILFSGKNKKHINLSSAENAQRVVKVNEKLDLLTGVNKEENMRVSNCKWKNP